MAKLGDFLEAVYGMAERFRTVRATIRHSRKREMAERASGGNRTVMGRRKVRNDSTPHLDTTNLSVWIALPDRVRTEQLRRRHGKAEESLVVKNGEQWSHRDHEGHVEIGGGRRPCAGLSDIERHFDHGRLREFFAALALEYVGPIKAAGQECIR